MKLALESRAQLRELIGRGRMPMLGHTLCVVVNAIDYYGLDLFLLEREGDAPLRIWHDSQIPQGTAQIKSVPARISVAATA
jgi:hypothetical protein